MLTLLSIRNYALITSLDVEFREGLNMITGETGAGKSILLGALSLLLGNRADSQVLKDKDQKCSVEGTFRLNGLGVEEIFLRNDLDYDDLTLIRREITPQGKSRAFINDTPVNLNVLRELGGRLVDIHSQHQNLMVNDPSYALHIIDQFGLTQGLAGEYSTHFGTYREQESRLKVLQDKLERARADQDYLEFQLSQLDEARLSADEQERLEQEQLVLENAGEIHLQIHSAVQNLHDSEDSVLSRIKQIISGLNGIASCYGPVREPLDNLNALYIELQELARELAPHLDHVEPDPERLQEIIERLDLINTLEKKHQVASVQELIELRDELKDRLNRIQTSDEEITALRSSLEKSRAVLESAAGKLSDARRKALPEFEERVSALARELGMPNARFEVHYENLKDFGPDGRDEVRFWFSANKNQATEELSLVASGGETSRIMLSIKSLVSNSLAIPTVIFDEIDSGVSGDIADKVGNLIARISSGRQVLNITHLPQVASKGDHHFKVYKYDDADATHTTIRLLTREERITELAQMLSGENITPEAIRNARVLLKE